MHIRVWDDVGLILIRAASFVCVIRWKALMATWTPTELSGNCKYFWHKKLKGMNKIQGHRAKEGRQEIFCFTTGELGYKIQNFAWLFFFFFLETIILNRYTTFIFHLSICVCGFGVYSFVPICIDETFHALWLAVMSQPEDCSWLIIFALVSPCITVPCGWFYSYLM